MHFLSIVLFIISADLDSFVIGISYGIRKIKIDFKANLIIGSMTLAGTLLSMIFGKALLHFIPNWIADIFGSCIIILIGLYCLLRFIIHKYTVHTRTEEFVKKTDRVSILSLSETVALGIGLTVNNIGLGIGSSIMGFPITVISIGSFLFNLLLLGIGNYLGHSRISGLLGEYADPLSGILMIVIGFYEIFLS